MNIEDRIISLLDGELSSADQHTLFADISASPKNQQLLRHHQMLRSMARTSLTAVSTPVGFEEHLLSTIATLPLTQSIASTAGYQRTAMASLLLLIAALGTTLLLRTDHTEYTTSNAFTSSSANIVSNVPSSKMLFGSAASSQVANNSKTELSTNVIGRNSIRAVVTNVNRENNSFDIINNSNESASITPHNTITPSPQELAIVSLADVQSQHTDITRNRVHSIVGLRNSREDSYPSFEVSLQTSSGFTSPADQQAIKPFAEQRLSLGYHLGYSDVVGVRVSSGLYQMPGEIHQTTELGITVMQQDMVTRRSFGGELFASHQFAGVLGTRLTAVITAAAGIIPNGSTLALESGVRIPFTDDVAFSVDFSLTRVHSNVERSSATISSANTSSSPIMYVGSDVRTTLNGSLHYGIQYRF